MFNQVMALIDGEINPLLEGDPGVGKTAFAKALAVKLNVQCFYVCLSHREGVEVHGNQVVKKETVKVEGREYSVVEQAPPKYVIDAVKSPNGALLVFDELTRIPLQTAGPTLAIFGEWLIGEVKLPRERTAMIACSNPSGHDPGCWRLPAATCNRFAKLKFKVNPIEWANQFVTYWNDPPKIVKYGRTLDEHRWARARTVVAAYIRQFADQLNQMPTTPEETQFGSCRSWDFLSRAIVTAEDRELDVNERAELYAGIVGVAKARGFEAWYDNLDVPAPHTIVDDPDSLPDKLTVEKYFYIVRACVEEVKYRKRVSENSAQGDPKSAKALAARSWERMWVIIRKASKGGCPRDILTLAGNDLATNIPFGAKPPGDVEELISTAMAAGLQWDNKRKT